jgi:hypothetical protein
MPVKGVPFDDAGRDGFLNRPQIAVYAVLDPHGDIHATPVWYLYRDGAFRMLVDRGSAKHRYSAAARRAGICVETDEGGQFQYVLGQGPVEVVDPVPIEYRRELWAHYTSDENAAEVIKSRRHERQVALLLRPDRWVTRAQVETDEAEEQPRAVTAG